MLKQILFVFFCCAAVNGSAESDSTFNINFEIKNASTGLPRGWFQCNINKDDDQDNKMKPALSLDSVNRKIGNYSLLIDWTNGDSKWTGAGYTIKKALMGKRIRLKGFVKTEDVKEWAGLWMRVDGKDKTVLAFDNMQHQPIKGTTDWKEYSISLDYDQDKADLVTIGGLIEGSGKMWLNNLQVSIDGVDLASQDVIKKEITLDTLSVSAPSKPPGYQAAATRAWEIKNTRIALTFDWIEKKAAAREWMRLHPYFYETDSLVLDAKSMDIDSLALVGKNNGMTIFYGYANDKLTIHFNHKYQARDTIDLFIKYTARPYATPTGGSMAISDDRGLYFINTDHKIPHKPAMVWTQGETESNSHWMVTLDKPNTRFTTQVELTVPDSLTTLSNGALTRQIKGKDGMRTDVWKMNMPIQAYAVMFAIGKFSVVKDHWRGKEVNYYVEPEYAPYAKLMFNHTPEMMDYFSEITGVAFPWNKYSQVVVRDYISGAMENTSAALFGEFMNGNSREIADHNQEDVVSHELFHEWFGDYVTCESWSNITVNESFANYGEQLWRAHKYGKAAGDELAYSDLQIYLYTSQNHDPQLVRYNYDSREEVFDGISYNKGGAILRYLNQLMGEAAFERAMNIYLTKNALHSAEAANWRMAVEEATGQDWNWFFNQWYFHAGHPVLKVAYDYNDSLQRLRVVVSQTQNDSTFMYQLPLRAELINGNNTTFINWNINKRRDTFTYSYINGVRPVLIPDVDHVLPGDIKDGKKPAQWLAQYINSDDYISKRLAVSGAGKLMSDSNSQVLLTLALDDSLHDIRSHALTVLKNAQSDKYHKKWTRKVTEMAFSDKNNAVRGDAIEVLGEWKVTSEKEKLLAAVNDSSYTVAGAALNAVDRMDNDNAYFKAIKMLDYQPKSSLQSAIWSIIGSRAADEDIVLYEKYTPYFLGTKKFTIAQSLGKYLRNVKSDSSFEAGIAIYATLVNNESMKALRSSFGGMLFQVASDEKENKESDKKDEAESGKKRLEMMHSYLKQIMENEKDPETRKDYSKMMTEYYG